MKSVCLCGSFKFYNRLVELSRILKSNGIVCYEPSPFKYRNRHELSCFTDAWFQLSYADKLEASKYAELAHLERIAKADVTYIINPSGYVGNTVILEIGYAYAKGKPIYALERIEDPAIMSLIRKTVKPEALAKLLRRR